MRQVDRGQLLETLFVATRGLLTPAQLLLPNGTGCRGRHRVFGGVIAGSELREWQLRGEKMTHKILPIMSKGHLLSLKRRAPKQIYCVNSCSFVCDFFLNVSLVI